MANLQIKLLTETATVPSIGSEGSAGYDLYSNVPSDNIIIPPHGKALIKTGIAIAIPEGYYGRIAPRSSLGWKYHIDVGAGVIDRDYRGEIGVVLYNLGDTEYVVKHKERIAQLILTRYVTPDIDIVSELDDTKRGEGGYGSTGK